MDHETTEMNTDVETGPTEQVETETQGKVFTQDDVNAMIEKRLKREQAKYSDIDLSEYSELKAAKEKAENDKLMKKNEFEKLLTKQKEKYDGETQQLRSKLENIQIDGALLNAAVQQKAVNAQQISDLLRGKVKLDEDGNAVVLDDEGQVRYNTETAKAYSVEELVSDFVKTNPHFLAATPSGTGSVGNTTPNPGQSSGILKTGSVYKNNRPL